MQGKPIFTGSNVRTPLAILGAEVYRLSLFADQNRPGEGFLVMSMTLQFQFNDGKSKKTKGKKLLWSDGDRIKFANEFKAAISNVWTGRHRLTTDNPQAPIRDVGVFFDFKTLIDGWHLDDDYELSVEMIDPGGFETSYCNYFLGNTSLDSEDLNYIHKPTQRGAVHEFGHMLGLRDEYPAAKSNASWSETDSVMYLGETVKPRHYAPFAKWLTEQYEELSGTLKKPIEFKVEGFWTMDNSSL